MGTTAEQAQPLNLRHCLTIGYPDYELELLSPPRAALKRLRENVVLLQSYWIEVGFSTADLVARDDAWALMKAIAQVFPRKDNPAVAGFDIEPLQTDLEQLEQLFLTKDRAAGELMGWRDVDEDLRLNIYIDIFVSCKLLEFCRFEGRLVLQDAHRVWRDRLPKKPAPELDETVAQLLGDLNGQSTESAPPVAVVG